MATNRRVIRMVTATEAKNRFGDLIKGAYLRDEHLIVKRGGIPVVAIVPMADYERLLNAEELDLPADIAQEVASSIKAVHARARLVRILEEAQEWLPNVPEEEVEADVQAAIQAVRRKKRTKQAQQAQQ